MAKQINLQIFIIFIFANFKDWSFIFNTEYVIVIYIDTDKE